MHTNHYKAILNKELDRKHCLNTETRDRPVWRQCPQGRDWLVLGAQQGNHFAFRENILQGIKENRNPAYAILLGSRAEKWYVFEADLMPLVNLILKRKERMAPQPDGSIYYQVYYEISTDNNMCLSAYLDVELAELPELSNLVNQE